MDIRRLLAMPRTVLARFRRVTTSGSYLPEIDGLRCLAIAAVVALHVEGYWTVQAGRGYATRSAVDRAIGDLIPLGTYGVHLFFVISGFVLALPFCRHALAGAAPVDLRRYAWRRLTRLEPPYVVSMLLFFLLMPAFGKGSWGDLWPHLLASLGYVHELVYGEASPINNNAWSLEIEIQFYLLMPLLAAVLGLPAAARRAVLVAGVLALSLHGLWLPAGAPRSLLQFGQYFLVGILLCDVWTSDWRRRARTWAADLPGLAAWPLFAWVNLRHPGLVAEAVTPWLIGMLVASALLGRGHSRVLAWGAVPVIGGMCYSIYLLHARVIAAVIHGVLARLPLTGCFAGDYAVALAVCGVAVLAVSAVFFRLVEQPCMDPDWPRRVAGWCGWPSARSAGGLPAQSLASARTE